MKGSKQDPNKRKKRTGITCQSTAEIRAIDFPFRRFLYTEYTRVIRTLLGPFIASLKRRAIVHRFISEAYVCFLVATYNTERIMYCSLLESGLSSTSTRQETIRRENKCALTRRIWNDSIFCNNHLKTSSQARTLTLSSITTLG